MADPVAQILEQAQNVSGGAPFGDFFVQGYQSAQRDRELDQRDVGLAIERENTRIADVSMGLKLREGRAKQLVRLAEQEQDTKFTQAYQAWIERGAHKKDIPNLMGIVNGTSANHAVVGQFFERVKGIREVETSELQFKNMMAQVTDYEKETGDSPSSVEFDQNGASFSFGGGDGTLTATGKDMRSLVDARLSGDTEAAEVYQRRLGLTSLSDRDQAVFDSKLRAIRQELTNLMAVLKSSLLADPEESVEAIEEASAKAREQELKLIQEAYGIKPSDDPNDELKIFSNE